MSSWETALPIADVVPQANLSGRPAFFPVSVTKLAVMSVCTFGLYQIYWFYQNWRLVKSRDQSRISPPWRSVLGLLFCYPLFRRVRSMAQRQAIAMPSAALLFAAWVVATLLSYLPPPYLLLSFGSVIFMLPIQRAANRINAHVAPQHDPNRRFGALNIVTVLVGGLLAILSVIGAFIESTQA
ncbi:hypothetical protein [Pseudoxanthomonas sacheonensis]|uniref:DUF4234 domain-containing protein n=1 Tax=Pseudoxanthomonas sacheonensis TaxID=443615 RepID=A0ABU1RRG2_9GAMM|nr:hypothetical protein [Pseudoxanthomonas sacheonensis]MDR6841182.1 hypothetical protein [Pseudoxanthomonas sacheonensis]